jgi:hypothetical protein
VTWTASAVLQRKGRWRAAAACGACLRAHHPRSVPLPDDPLSALGPFLRLRVRGELKRLQNLRAKPLTEGEPVALSWPAAEVHSLEAARLIHKGNQP